MKSNIGELLLPRIVMSGPVSPFKRRTVPTFGLAQDTRVAEAPAPAFPADWAARQARFGSGLDGHPHGAVPYIENATAEVMQIAAERGIPGHIVELRSAPEMQPQSPSPYGAFGMVRGGRLLSYHYLWRKEFEKLLVATVACTSTTTAKARSFVV